ncbi:MAG: hypothetical protein IKX20_02800 [Paludibacteraceae bacterium]|nr:hypothetical protein [Paludibacteraceae bacterium]
MDFLDEGVRRIRRSPDVATACRSFDRSCAVCCTHGYQIRCDQCKIAEAYKEAKEGFIYLMSYKDKMKEVSR